MTIEEALRKIADLEPVVASETDGTPFCVYCHGEERYERWNTGASFFAHDDDCPWVYLKKQVEEDMRIEKELRRLYPATYIFAKWNLEDY